MKTNASQTSAFSHVLESESDVFSDLVELSGLRPQSDFQHSRLSGVDFAGSNLSLFDFDYADLRGANWANRSSDPHSLRYSLRGDGTDEVCGADFKDLSAKVLSKSLWAERFYAFRILVDNWGENPDTAETLSHLLSMNSGTYLPLCSFVYFTASYLNDSEAKTLCVNMANSGRSQVNIFRLRKLRQSAKQNARFLDSVQMKQRYPNDLTKKELDSLRHGLSNVIETSNFTETHDNREV
jgi:hypothetical protein